jgi:tRNA(Ser,Leu) C12 N-acetylase TAN1
MDMLEDWNVVVIGDSNREEDLLERLEGEGEFERSGFHDVLIGNVEDIAGFLEDAEQRKYPYVSRVIPIDESFLITPENLIDEVKERIERYIDEIEPGETVGFQVERRGMKEEISPQKVEREVSVYFYELVEKVQGLKPKLNLKRPEKLIVIEIVGNRCGLGFITREMIEKYSIIKAK